ncbi:MAG: ABC transporter permease [Bacteroidales bacterium]|nr:ABC transporter permease [Bacteroidales bacterium]
MKTILFLIQKEFLQIRRNRMMLPIIFVMPLIQLLILVQAATFEMKHIRMHLIDLDRSSTSRELISKFQGSPFYEITNFSFSEKEGEEDLKKSNADIIFQIPKNFEKDLKTNKKAKVQLVINAINSAAAGVINAYTISIISDYNRQIIYEWNNAPLNFQASSINVNYSYWFNPELNYTNFMVPGILVLLVTLIGALLSGMNIVREKEIGTIEQINVTPIKKYQFIIGKLLPFWFIALFELGFGLTIGKLLFNIPIVGSLWLLFGFAAVYLIVVLSIGLLISTINNTQQQSMFVTFFFMIVFILLSGLFTPVESMPDWAQKVDIINPVAYFIKVMRMILLKGSGFYDIRKEFISISIYALVILSFAVWRYRKTA